MTPEEARAEIRELYEQWVDAGMLAEGELEAIRDRLSVERDPDDPSKLVISIAPPVVPEWMEQGPCRQ